MFVPLENRHPNPTEAFYFPEHRLLYLAIQRLHSAGKPVAVDTIAADLEETYGFSARQVVIGLRSIADTLGSLVEVRRVFVAPAAVDA